MAGFRFVLQWHLTDKCGYRCLHCYHSHDVKNKKLRPDADTSLIKKRLAEFSEHSRRWNLECRVNFSGGDPLLHDDFFDIVAFNNSLGFLSGVLGNPKEEEDWKRIKENGIHSYQISLDGLEQTHDYFRGEGAFQKALHSLEISRALGVRSVVLATVTRQNFKEIGPLAMFLYKSKLVDVFDFSRVVPCGEAKNFNGSAISPEEYREFLFGMHELYVRFRNESGHSIGGDKEPLWQLLHKEIGYKVGGKNDAICEGCGVGFAGMTVDVDGSVYSCRRLGIVIGDINESPLYDIFMSSKEMESERRFEVLKKCSSCDLLKTCRGCRAVAYHARGSYFEEDPQCWRKT